MTNLEGTFFIALILTVVIMTAYQLWQDHKIKKKYDSDHQYRLFLFDPEINLDYLKGKSRQEQIKLLQAREVALRDYLEDRKHQCVRDHGSYP